MMRAGGAIAIPALVLALAAAPSRAQAPPSDPISDILARPALDLEDPQAAAPAPEVGREPGSPAAPASSTPRPILTRPVFVQEAGRTPDGPATAADLAYDSRLRSSAAAIAAFRGALDGGWVLLAGAREIYVLQLVDRDGAVQGAWRDTRRPGALDASGFIDHVERGEGSVNFRFGAEVSVALRADGNGRWVGDLRENGRDHVVILRRRAP